MQRTLTVWIVSIAVLALVVSEGRTFAQEHTPGGSEKPFGYGPSVSLSLASAYNVGLGFRDSNSFMLQSGESGSPNGAAKSHDYREISDFFNVREANVNTVAGEWELELEGD